ncbi:MAG: DMT family transporter [Halanaerobiales bacterium]|nr:DMT family transporter [Halanaerobiales bacterium]
MTNQIKAIIYLTFTIFAFSSMELGGKLVASQMSPLQVTFLRFTIGFLILLPFGVFEIRARVRKEKFTLTLRDIGWLAILGFCNIVLAMVLLQKAVTMIPASLTAIIVSSNPIFVVIFANIILKEKISLRTVLGLIIGIFGLSLVMNIFNSVSDINFVGIFTAVGAALFFGLYTVLSKKVVKRLGGMITNVGSFFIGNLALFCILLIKGEPILKGLNQSTIWPILYLGIVVTGLAYVTFLHGLSLIDASKGAVIFFFKPVIASLLAFLILKETIELNMIVGTFFVILGSIIMVLQKKVK